MDCDEEASPGRARARGPRVPPGGLRGEGQKGPPSLNLVRTLRRLRRTRGTPIYNIGAASRLCGLPIWTLRWIEKHGLVSPRRTDGNQRLFSDQDLDHLNMIRGLMEEKVNLAGIRVILRMRTGSAAGAGGKGKGVFG